MSGLDLLWAVATLAAAVVADRATAGRAGPSMLAGLGVAGLSVVALLGLFQQRYHEPGTALLMMLWPVAVVGAMWLRRMLGGRRG